MSVPDDRQAIVAAVREWVEREVYPVASDYEHADEYPEPLVEDMKRMGLFGVTIPEEYGGLGLDLLTYIGVIEIELSRGWMSLSGVLNTHFISAWMIRTHGTDEQRERYLPRMATGELRFAYSMTEPHAGSDVQAIRTRAVRKGDGYAITGQKMWATNGLRAGAIMLLAVTDPDAKPRHRGMTAFVVEKEPGRSSQPGLEVGAPIKKLGYKGVESVELSFDGFEVPLTGIRAAQPARTRLRLLHGRDRARPVNIARAPSASPRGHSRRRFATRSSARRSASRSPSTRPCS
jgi:butyryl-CoA dehydrogenase